MKVALKVVLKIMFLMYMLFVSVGSNKPRLWTKIPKYYVDNRVQHFINSNGITNCFEFQETETNLLLKCWRDNKLTDVSININPGKQQRREFIGISLSI